MPFWCAVTPKPQATVALVPRSCVKKLVTEITKIALFPPYLVLTSIATSSSHQVCLELTVLSIQRAR